MVVPVIELRNVTRRFGSNVVLDDVSLSVEQGTFVSLLGASGCGKSTTLRIMAGLDTPSDGSVYLNGSDVSQNTAYERNIAMVFQSYALYPHMTVAQNIALPLLARHLSAFGRLPWLGRLEPSSGATRRDIRRQVEEVAGVLGLEELLDRKPGTLSGGQKQRVALGRALVRDPEIFLLDEPLSNLDARLRVQMRSELVTLNARTGRAFVYVTHDQAEAMSMSDRIAIMMNGKIAQYATPKELYERPSSQLVAAFIGTHPINFILPDRGLAESFSFANGRIVGIRPEHLRLDDTGPLEGYIDGLEYLGSEIVLTLRQTSGDTVTAILPGATELPDATSRIRLGFERSDVHLFDARNGQRVEFQ